MSKKGIKLKFKPNNSDSFEKKTQQHQCLTTMKKDMQDIKEFLALILKLAVL